ncbi:MAG TPA: YtxH domain-containing protein [Candidatus Saccharimonadales bacterium]|jgi:gas vesicle protein|nr:YtxH domain-containing protein [Candidatus Saccharimonadales bacterium]
MSFTSRKRSGSAKKIALFSSIAAAAGFLAGILTAPQSGKATRGDIKQAADKGIGEAEKDLKKLNQELSKLISEAKTGGEKLSTKAQKELGELVEKAQDTREKGREMLSAIHEGEAQDKDLAKAIKDANLALKHLRDYLKK